MWQIVNQNWNENREKTLKILTGKMDIMVFRELKKVTLRTIRGNYPLLCHPLASMNEIQLM